MTFEQMKIFLEAAHFGSFTHAADWASPNPRSVFPSRSLKRNTTSRCSTARDAGSC